MASTRDRNTPGNYELEQSQFSRNINYNTYNSYGVPTITCFPGDGLLSGRVNSAQLSNNFCDIESDLFGIGSTNLVNPKMVVEPDIKKLSSLNMIERIPVILPANLVIDANQRPLR
jgi:hypothetical protein